MVSVGKECRQTHLNAQYVKKLIHKRCGRGHGDLWVADGFRYRRYDGTIQEADLAVDIMVNGETYECVRSICYLDYIIDGDSEHILLPQLESEMYRCSYESLVVQCFHERRNDK